MISRLYITSCIAMLLAPLLLHAAAAQESIGIKPLSELLTNNKAPENSFASLIRGKKPVVVKFFAQWCPPCRKMGPVVKKVAQTLADKATFAELDIDHYKELASKYIQSIPTIIVFKEGKELLRIQGTQTEQELKQKITHILK